MIKVPDDFDYVGVFLTDKCHLHCSYCITRQGGGTYGLHLINKPKIEHLEPDQWVNNLNRLQLPDDVPITLQGGEPFLYMGIWHILENIRHKVDILTALPPYLKPEHFRGLRTLRWNKRDAPYPTIRVSYHHGQHSFDDLIQRVAALKDIINIGVFALGPPIHSIDQMKWMAEIADIWGVEFRTKEFLGEYRGEFHGTYKYPEACRGKLLHKTVECRNTVAVIGPDGSIYRCHSDLYNNREPLGNILDDEFEFPDFLPCQYYGCCNPCDVKLKTDRFQHFNYTSVDINGI